MQDDGTPPVGNGRRMRTIEFDEADAPMLAAAMRLASATALMYGASQERARERYQQYRRLFLQFAPPEAAMFRNAQDWCEMAIEMDTAPDFELIWKPEGWPNQAKGRVSVRIGERVWRTDADPMLREGMEGLAAALEAMAPAGCIRTVPAETAED
jgi:hypothetical protein